MVPEMVPEMDINIVVVFLQKATIEYLSEPLCASVCVFLCVSVCFFMITQKEIKHVCSPDTSIQNLLIASCLNDLTNS